MMATAATAPTGVRLGYVGTVTNSGTINGDGGDGGTGTEGWGGVGVRLPNGGTVVNLGTTVV
jgi:hypothetical protein